MNICKICNQQLDTPKKLGCHKKIYHKISKKEYYLKYIKQPGDEICSTCGQIKILNRWTGEYNEFCSKKCAGNSPIWQERREQNNLKKYGVKHSGQIPGSREKSKQTCLKKYGVEFSHQNPKIREKFKQTMLKQYGVENATNNLLINNKRKQTLLDRYGVDNSAKLPNSTEKMLVTYKQRHGTVGFQNQEKFNKTCLEKYGVENPIQNPNIKNKMMESNKKSMFTHKSYTLPSGKTIHIQGYEPQFLNHIFTNNLLSENEIDYNPDSIKYVDENNKEHQYYPDFYIPKLNLIVEIKSSYTVITDKNVELKKQACLNKNLNYLRIINNNFDEFIKLNTKFLL